MAKTIVVSNRKGGVGKTTVSVHLAAGMSALGLSVLLVDTDSQGHVASALGLPKRNSLYELMTDPAARISDNIYLAPKESYCPEAWEPAPLYVLPSDKKTSRIMDNQPSPFKFKAMLNDLAEDLKVDYVIVDTAPTNTTFDGLIMMSADQYMFVVEPASLSFDGLQSALNEIELVNAEAKKAGIPRNPIETLGIVPNKIRASTNNHRENIATLSEHFGAVVFRPLMLRTVFESAFEYGRTVYAYAPASAEHRMFFEHVLNPVLKRLGEIEHDSTVLDEILTQLAQDMKNAN